MSKSTATSHLRDVFGVTCVGIGAAAIGVRGHFNGTIPGGDLMYVAQIVCGGILAFSWHSSQKYMSCTAWRARIGKSTSAVRTSRR